MITNQILELLSVFRKERLSIMMKKRNVLFTAAAVMGLTLAVGCGQPAVSGNGGAAANTPAQTQSGVAPKYETKELADSSQSSSSGESSGENGGVMQTIRESVVSQETNGQQQTSTSGGNMQQGQNTSITEEDAKATALADAGVNEADVNRLRVKRDWDDGRHIYEVEFYVDRQEYDYDIDASTGTIVSKDYDIDDDFYRGQGQNAQGNSQSNVISEDEAIQIVLDRIKGASASDVWMKLDYDDGRVYYEGDVYYEQKEYEFEMDAYTGEILEWSEERFGR